MDERANHPTDHSADNSADNSVVEQSAQAKSDAEAAERWQRFLIEDRKRTMGSRPMPTKVQRFDAEVNTFVGRRIRSTRQNDGVTQAALSADVSISQARLSRIEHGYACIKASELVRIAIRLGRSLEWFIEPPEDLREDIVRTGWEPVVRAPFDLDAFLNAPV